MTTVIPALKEMELEDRGAVTSNQHNFRYRFGNYIFNIVRNRIKLKDGDIIFNWEMQIQSGRYIREVPIKSFKFKNRDLMLSYIQDYIRRPFFVTQKTIEDQ